ncbi:MAG: sulfotransferase, partial [Candidatus Hodarchaeota archaeon]
MSIESKFKSIFIVGPPRCGTTLLAVLLDRHSRIAVPAETHFFDLFLPGFMGKNRTSTYEEMVKTALAFKRIAETPLNSNDVLKRFKTYRKNWGNLLRAILESYTTSQGKVRPAEKTPRHIYHVPTILKLYPDAKIICIIRDGRDMVRSMMQVPWGTPNLIGHHCVWWEEAVRLGLKYADNYPYRFRIVKYEDLLSNPVATLSSICNFIGEEFENRQLQSFVRSHVVPDRARRWKGKANLPIDPDRNQAWRREAGQKEIWAINSKLGRLLQKMGYEDNDLNG